MTPDSLTYSTATRQAGDLIGNLLLFFFFVAVASSIYFWFNDEPKAVDSKLWRKIK